MSTLASQPSMTIDEYMAAQGIAPEPDMADPVDAGGRAMDDYFQSQRGRLAKPVEIPERDLPYFRQLARSIATGEQPQPDVIRGRSQTWTPVVGAYLAAQDVPAQWEPHFLSLVQEEAKANSRSRGLGMVGRVGEGLVGGAARAERSLDELIGDVAGGQLPPEVSARTKRILAAKAEADQPGSTIGRWTVTAAEQLPSMAIGAAAFASGGGAVAGGLRAGAYWLTQIAPERIDEYREEGMDDTAAGVAGTLSAAAESAIELINPRLPGLPAARAAARNRIRAFVGSQLKQFGKELSEEALQAATSEIAQGIGQLASDDPATRGAGQVASDAFEGAIAALIDSAGPLAILQVAGGGARLARSALSREQGVTPEEAAVPAKEATEADPWQANIDRIVADRGRAAKVVSAFKAGKVGRSLLKEFGPTTGEDRLEIARRIQQSIERQQTEAPAPPPVEAPTEPQAPARPTDEAVLAAVYEDGYASRGRLRQRFGLSVKDAETAIDRMESLGYVAVREAADGSRRLEPTLSRDDAALAGVLSQIEPLELPRLQAQFPGATIEQRGNTEAVVTLPNKASFTVRKVPFLPMAREHVRRAYGDAAADDADMVAVGSFELRLPNDNSYSGAGLLQLVNTAADDATLRHERLHVARSLGLFSNAEWQALAKKYAPKAAEPQQEERVAAAAESEDARKTVWAPVNRFVRSLFRSIAGPSASDVLMKLDTRQFWERTALSPDDAVRKFQLRKRTRKFNPAQTQEVGQLVENVREAMGPQEVQSDREAEQLAAARLARDEPGEIRRLVNAARTGSLLENVDAVVARNLINSRGWAAVQSGDPAALRDAVAVVEAEETLRSAGGRGFRQLGMPRKAAMPRGDRQRLELVKFILGMPGATKRALQKALGAGDAVTAEKIRDRHAETVALVRRDLIALGIDLNTIDPAKLSHTEYARILRTASVRWATHWDKTIELYRNILLSGSKTQVRNFTGNTVYATYRAFATRPLEALVGSIARAPGAPKLGELVPMWRAMFASMPDAMRNAMLSFDTEIPYFERSIGAEGSVMWEQANVAIAGPAGRAVRLPQRVLLLADEFAKTIVARGEATAQAHRMAIDEELTGEDYENRVADLVNDYDSPAWDTAITEAKGQAFQEKPGPFMEAAFFVRGIHPAMHFPAMFITTPGNLMKLGIRMSPLGMARLFWQVPHAVRTGDWSRVPRTAVDGLIAMGVFWALYASMDPDRPWIYGGAEPDPALRNTIRIGSRGYKYNWLGPHGMAMSGMVDTANAITSGDPERIISAPFVNLLGQVHDLTFLSGVSDLVNVFYQQQGERGPQSLMYRVVDYLGDFATSWVPSIVRETGRELSPTYSERRVWGQSPENYTRLLKRLLQKTELHIVPDQPKVDLWGRQVSRRVWQDQPAGDFLIRMLNPATINTMPVFVGDVVLRNWNLKNPDNPRRPELTRPTMEIAGKTVYLTDEQYTRYAQVAGQWAAQHVQDAYDRGLIDPYKPTKAQVEHVTKLIAAGRKRARLLLQSDAARQGAPPPANTP